jgi:hypothetical protein
MRKGFLSVPTRVLGLTCPATEVAALAAGGAAAGSSAARVIAAAAGMNEVRIASPIPNVPQRRGYVA